MKVAKSPRLVGWSIAMLVTFLMVSESYAPLALAEQAAAGKRATLGGWQKAKFGMSIAQVKTAFPEVSTDLPPLTEDCKSMHEESLREYIESATKNNVVAEEWNWDCDRLSMDYDAGRYKFSVKFAFLRGAKTLEEVRMELFSPDSESYSYYQKLLTDKYGKGQESENLKAQQDHCEELSRRVAQHGILIGADVMGYANILNKQTTFSFSDGQITLRAASVMGFCPVFRQSEFLWDIYKKYAPEWQKRDTLKIRYTHNRSMEDMKNF